MVRSADSSVRNAVKLGMANEPGRVDTTQLGDRIDDIVTDITGDWTDMLTSQGVEIIRGTGRFASANEAPPRSRMSV